MILWLTGLPSMGLEIRHRSDEPEQLIGKWLRLGRTFPFLPAGIELGLAAEDEKTS